MTGEKAFLLTIEVTDAWIIMMPELVFAVAPVIVTIRGVGVGMKMIREIVSDPNPVFMAFAEEKFLIRFPDRHTTQIPDAILQQFPQEELLPIHPGEVESLFREKAAQPGRDKSPLARVSRVGIG